MDKVNLADKLALLSKPWDPRVVAEANGQELMVVRFEGEFPFHVHEDADDVFLVIEGRIEIDLEEPGGLRSVALGPGELMVVPAGVRHRPRAEAEARVLLIEPKGLPNTGDPATAAAKAPI
jgi:mannose-6-phosphate isomerase-like protein (cupin superfamily)